MEAICTNAAPCGFGQVILQFVGFAIEDAIALLDSGLSDRMSEMTFASARWA